MDVAFYEMLFVHLLRWLCLLFFFFVNVVYHFDWFANIEKSLHPWNKSNLIMVYDCFLYIVGLSLLIFCWGFLHLISWKILACKFLFYSVFVCFGYQHNLWLLGRFCWMDVKFCQMLFLHQLIWSCGFSSLAC